MESKPFGYLLTLDCYGCNSAMLDSLDHTYNYLITLVEKLGVSMQSLPNVIRTPRAFPDKAGLTGSVYLVESSITIHTLTIPKFISVDIYCCRELNQAVMKEITHQFYAPTEFETHFIPRGTKYPRIQDSSKNPSP